MPLLCTAGAASARGFGELYQLTTIANNGWMARIGAYTNLGTKDTNNNIYVAKTSSAFVLKVGPDGTLAWQNNIVQSTNAISIKDIKAIGSSSIAVSGQTLAGTIANKPAFSLLNTDGTVSSSTYFNVSLSAFFSGSSVSAAGSLYVSGLITSGSTSFFRIYNGAVVTKRLYTNASNGLYFIGGGAGDTAYLGDPLYGVVSCLTKIDSNFSVLWKLSSNGFLIKQVVESNGFAYAVAAYSSNFYILKFNASNGILVWARTLSANLGACLVLDNADNIYAGGYSSGTKNGVVAKIDSNGALVWQRYVSILGLPAYDSTVISSIFVNNPSGTICIQVSPAYNSTAYSILLSVPNDGTLTGTYTAGGTSVTYGVNSSSFSTVSPAFSSPTISFGTSTSAEASVSLAPSATAYTYNKVSVP